MNFEKPSDAKVVFMGTPEIAAKAFSRLIEEGYDVVALITNEDKEVGRKRILEPTPCKKVALAHGIPVYQPHRIRLEHDFLSEIPCDVIVTMAYGQIVPNEVLDHPKHGCINLHGSLLPEYRGAAPMQRAIMDGKTETGVTLMQMIDKMDAGLMYDKAAFPIESTDTYSTVYEKMGDAAADLIAKDLLPYLNGELPGEAQDESKVSIASKIKPEDEHLSLSLSSVDFVNMVRGLSLIPGGYLFLDGKKLKVLSAAVASSETGHAIGEIVSDKKGLFIQLSDGVVSVLTLQPEGKKPMDAKSFVNGQHNLLGKILD